METEYDFDDGMLEWLEDIMELSVKIADKSQVRSVGDGIEVDGWRFTKTSRDENYG